MAARNPPASSAAPEQAPAPAKPKSKLLLILVIVLGTLVVAGAAVGGTWFWLSRHNAEASDEEEPKAKTAKGEKGKKEKKEKEAERKPPVFVTMEPYTVNLRNTGREHYLQVGLVLQAADGVAAEAVKANMPAIRSAVLLLLAAKTPEELAAPEGKEKLADEVLQRVIQPIPGMPPVKGVDRVLFSGFIIQ